MCLRRRVSDRVSDREIIRREFDLISQVKFATPFQDKKNNNINLHAVDARAIQNIIIHVFAFFEMIIYTCYEHMQNNNIPVLDTYVIKSYT